MDHFLILFCSYHQRYSCMSSLRREGLAPMSRSTTSPPLINTKVGMADTLYSAAVSAFSSTSTLRNMTSSNVSLNSLYFTRNQEQHQNEMKRKKRNHHNFEMSQCLRSYVPEEQSSCMDHTRKLFEGIREKN